MDTHIVEACGDGSVRVMLAGYTPDGRKVSELNAQREAVRYLQGQGYACQRVGSGSRGGSRGHWSLHVWATRQASS